MYGEKVLSFSPSEKKMKSPKLIQSVKRKSKDKNNENEASLEPKSEKSCQEKTKNGSKYD